MARQATTRLRLATNPLGFGCALRFRHQEDVGGFNVRRPDSRRAPASRVRAATPVALVVGCVASAGVVGAQTHGKPRGVGRPPIGSGIGTAAALNNPNCYATPGRTAARGGGGAADRAEDEVARRHLSCPVHRHRDDKSCSGSGGRSRSTGPSGSSPVASSRTLCSLAQQLRPEPTGPRVRHVDAAACRRRRLEHRCRPSAGTGGLNNATEQVLVDVWLRWLFNGLQAAGPKLTPKSFEQGLFATPAFDGAASDNPSTTQTAYGRTPGLPYDEYMMVGTDFAPVWYDAETTDASNVLRVLGREGCALVPRLREALLGRSVADENLQVLRQSPRSLAVKFTTQPVPQVVAFVHRLSERGRRGTPSQRSSSTEASPTRRRCAPSSASTPRRRRASTRPRTRCATWSARVRDALDELEAHLHG